MKHNWTVNKQLNYLWYKTKTENMFLFFYYFTKIYKRNVYIINNFLYSTSKHGPYISSAVLYHKNQQFSTLCVSKG